MATEKLSQPTMSTLKSRTRKFTMTTGVVSFFLVAISVAFFITSRMQPVVAQTIDTSSTTSDTIETSPTTDVTATSTDITPDLGTTTTSLDANILVLTTDQAVLDPSITTDKTKYSVGEGMVINGSGFTPDSLITISVLRPDHETDMVPNVISDATGSFTVIYVPSIALPGRFKITATDGVNNAATAATEADAVGYDKAGYDKGSATWGTGNQSGYSENDWVQYQYTITGVTGTVPNFNVVFDDHDSSVIFIDALTNFRFAVDAPMVASESVLDNGVSEPPATDGGVDAHGNSWYAFVPLNINNTYTSGSCSGTDALNDPSPHHCFHIDPVTIHASNPNFPASFATGTHTVTIYFEAHLAASFAWSTGHESSLSNPASIYGIHAPAAAVPANTVYGAHIYDAWTTAAFSGSAGITGASKHFNLQDQSDGPKGSITLPIPAVDLSGGTVTIVKVTNPTSVTGVSFPFTSDFGPFTLDTDPSATFSSSTTYIKLPAGSYNFGETQPVAGGLTLKNISCVNGIGNSTFSTSTVTGATTVNLVSGGVATCTYTNATNRVAAASTTDTRNSSNVSGAVFGTGATVHDTATFGAVGGGAVPTGTVFFNFYRNLACGGAPAATSSNLALDGSGFVDGTSFAQGPLVTGQYSFQAHYSGDNNYLPGLVACEPLTIVDANISVSPLTANNEVNHAHTITVAVLQNPGTGTTTSSGALVTFSLLNNTAGATFVGGINTCTTNGSGQCTVQINTATAGGVDVHAVSTFNVAGFSLTRATGDGLSGDSANAHKNYVNANIAITPLGATNPVGAQHIFTITVTQIPGSVTPATTTSIRVAVTPLPSTQSTTCGPAVAFSGNTATCTLTINSTTTGVFIANASTTLTLGGVALNRATGDANAGDSAAAVKTYVAGTIIIRKVTVPGGSSTSFGFTTTGGVSPATFSLQDGGSKTYTNIAPGTYSVTENNPLPTYAVTSINCSATTGSTTSAVGTIGTRTTNITLGAGGTVDCTYTNSLQQGTLVVIKHVINDNGGTSTAAAFSLHVTSSSSDVVGSPAAGSETGTIYKLNQGTYVVGENTPITGYIMTSISGDCNSIGSVLVTPGATSTCTITNDDIQPKLTLTKIVVNDNGGNAVVSDFPLSVGSTTVTSGVQSGFNVGTYTASELNLPGYTAGTWTGDCATNGSFTLSSGDVKACTITNDDQPAHIVLKKVVINDNGGIAGINDFGLSVGSSTVQSGATTTVNSNVPTALNEAGLTGYSFTSITGDAKCPAVLGGTVTLDEGETVSCTITNDDIQPKLIVIKHVINNNGGTKVAGYFMMNVTGTNVSTSTFPGNELGTTVNLDTGSYSADESKLAGYTASTSTDCVGTINIGETKTCTITNDDQPGHLIVHKVTNPSSDTTTSFSITPTGGVVVSPTATEPIVGGGTVDYTVNAGTFNVSEATMSGWSKDTSACQNIAVGLGETKECTIVNTKLANLTIIKDSQPNDLQVFNFNVTGLTPSNFTLDDDAGVADDVDNISNTQAFTNISFGSYTVTEPEPNSFWKSGGVSCVVTGTQTPYASTSIVTNGITVNLTPGTDVTCTFVNIKQSPTRSQGFWQTHTAYTSSIFASAPINSSMPIGTTTHKGFITTTGQLFGGFYGSIPKTTTGAKRSDVDKARMQLLQQLIAAKLNCAAFGCATSVKMMISTADTAYAFGSASQILASASVLDAYNNSGETITTGKAGNATPKTSQGLANLVFWDLP